MQRRTVPDPRDILDFSLNKIADADADCQGIHEGRVNPDVIAPQYPFVEALSWARPATADPTHYVDVHCWVVTPRHFARLMADLSRHDVVHLGCAGFVDTAPPGFEFNVHLYPETDRDRRVASWESMLAEAADPLPGSHMDSTPNRDACQTPALQPPVRQENLLRRMANRLARMQLRE